MISSVIKFFSTLFSTYRVYIALVLILSSLGGSAYIGYKVAYSHYANIQIKELESTVRFYNAYLAKLWLDNDKLNNKEAEIRYVTKEVIKEVKVYIDSHPELADCKLDATGLRLWNGNTSTK